MGVVGAKQRAEQLDAKRFINGGYRDSHSGDDHGYHYDPGELAAYQDGGDYDVCGGNDNYDDDDGRCDGHEDHDSDIDDDYGGEYDSGWDGDHG